jgi:predicted DNA-binding WGR domain protein
MATLKQKVTLVCSDASGDIDGVQHNKVWYGELYDNDDVITRWGRVGYDLQSKTFPGVGEEFLLKKKKEKMGGKKGYTEARVVDAATPASAAKPVAQSNLREIARSQLLKSSHPVLDKLIERLVKSNVHKITSSTNIVLNDATGLFQTPLGIVTPDAIVEARTLLADTIPFVKNGKYGVELERLVSQYLRLIPQNIGMRFNVRNILPDVSAVQKQGDILDSLDASYQAISQGKNTPKDGTKADKPVEQVFQVDLDVENGNDAARLEAWYEKSKKSQHGYDRIKVRNVFKVKIHDMAKAFVTDNETEVFHGTSEANCLSILKSGLRTSPPSTAAIAGKMWGNGVYGAINSSKSLGYTYGRWGQSSGESGWLFICKFSMGKVHYPRGYGNCSRPPSGHDSVWATVANTGLNHDELIVYTNNRVTITHLLECK